MVIMSNIIMITDRTPSPRSSIRPFAFEASDVDSRHRWSKRIARIAALMLLAFALLIPNAGHAQSSRAPGDLLTPRTGTTRLSARVKRAQRCLVNALALNEMTLNIALFPDRKIVALRDRHSRLANGDTIWVGRVLGEPFSRVTLTSRSGVVAGSIELARYGGSEVYEIAPTPEGDSTVSQVVMTYDVCPTELPVGDTTPGSSPPPVAGDGTVSTIDLLVAYTPASRAAYGKSGLEAMIMAAVADANTAYQNTDIHAQLQLKAMVEVAYTEDGSISSALSRLQAAADGFMDNVHSLRETHLADVVTLVCEDSSSAGIGYVMTAPSTSFAPYAFNVIYSGALSGLTLPHEIAHHMGCQHNRENASTQGAYPDAYGMRNCTNNGTGFRTIMSYHCSDAPRIPYFSTPNLAFNGFPLGIAHETDPSKSCDNARCINLTAATLAAFRSSTSPVPVATTALTATAVSSSQVNLSWTDNATNESGFRIHRSVDQVVWAEIATVPSNSTAYTDTSVIAGTTYYFKVVAYNSAGTSGDSNLGVVTTPAMPIPAAPAALVASTASSSQINLTWTDPSTNEAGFRIERSLDGVNFATLTNLGVNAVSFADTGLTASKPYWYRIYAYNSGGPSAYSNTATTTTSAPVAVPKAPASLALTVSSSSSITLKWRDYSSNESGFVIERSLNGTTFAQIATVGAGIITFKDTFLSPLTKHWYRVCAYNSGGNSAYTAVVAATTVAIPPIPNAPTLPTLTVVNNASLKLGWKDNASNEAGFKIERSADGAAFTEIATTGPSVVTFTNTGLTALTPYFYRVRAFNDGGNSAYTPVVTATTPPPPPPPIAPTTLTLLVKSSSQINLTWSDKSTNETGFKIEISLDGVNFYQLAAVAASTRSTASYSCTGLKTKTRYHYRVRAYNSGGDSGYTNVASATTL
jgi:hypothetical protein